jgi:hypothetical protein
MPSSTVIPVLPQGIAGVPLISQQADDLLADCRDIDRRRGRGGGFPPVPAHHDRYGERGDGGCQDGLHDTNDVLCFDLSFPF